MDSDHLTAVYKYKFLIIISQQKKDFHFVRNTLGYCKSIIKKRIIFIFGICLAIVSASSHHIWSILLKGKHYVWFMLFGYCKFGHFV